MTSRAISIHSRFIHFVALSAPLEAAERAILEKLLTYGTPATGEARYASDFPAGNMAYAAFTDADTGDSPRVVIVDEQLAARFWPNQDPIGRRAYIPARPEDVGTPGPTATWLRVVGVVGSMKLKGLEEGENARVGSA